MAQIIFKSFDVLSLENNIPLPIYNSNDIVMSRENQNFHLRFFAKGGALHKVFSTPLDTIIDLLSHLSCIWIRYTTST
jgi:hypothetical protein